VSLSSSHQVFLNWNRSLSLKRKPSLSELSPHFKASLSSNQVFLSEKNHQSISMSLSLKKPFCLVIYELATILKRCVAIPIDSTKQVFLWRRSLSPIFFFWKKESKSFVTINVFLIKGIPVFHNPGIIICYGKEKQNKTTTKKWTPRKKKPKPQQKIEHPNCVKLEQ